MPEFPQKVERPKRPSLVGNLQPGDTKIGVVQDPSRPIDASHIARFRAYWHSWTKEWQYSEAAQGLPEDQPRKKKKQATVVAAYSGYLQADAYGGYDGIYAGGDIVEVACMAHCCRYWWEARTACRVTRDSH